MCGGSDPTSFITDPISEVIGTDGSGGGLLGGLAQLDSAVNNGIPGGWATVGGAALLAAGITDPTLLGMADSGTLTEASISNAGFDPNALAQQIDPFAGLSANAPVDTTLSQAAANALAAGTTGAAASSLGTDAALMGPTYGELGVTGVPEGGMGPTYAEMGATGLNTGEAVAAADAAAYAAANNISLADAYKALSAANQVKNLASTGYNLLTGKGVPSTFSRSSGLGSYGANLTGDTTGGATAPNLTPDLTKGNIDFTLMGAPTTSTTPQTYAPATNQMLYAPQQAPTFAQGGEFEEEPQFYSVGGLESMNNHYVQGDGDGTSDSVNAKLADGEFVIPADVVAKLGNGSNNAGASVLDQFLTTIREHKQENGTKLEPDSKGPLAYLLDAKKKARA
jgi:hypothetical protein